MKSEITDRINELKSKIIPCGYKLDNNVVIPEEWENVKLSSLVSSLDSGVSVNSEDRPCEKEEYGILKTSCASNGRFYPNENKVIIDKDLNRAKLNPKKGMLLISRMNTPELVGEIGYVDKDYENLFIPDRLWQTNFSELVDSKWLVSYMTMSKVKREIKNIATGTSNSMKNISKDNFLSIEILKPSFSEQQKIAEILSIWDKSIELKEQLIEEKKKQKSGLMQKLLTGKVRLPGFDGEWEEVKLGSVIKEIIEKTTQNNQFMVLTSSRQGIFLQEDYFKKNVASSNNTGYKIIHKGQFTYRTMSDDGSFKFNRLLKYDVGIVSPAYVVFEAISIDPVYLSNMMDDVSFNQHVKKETQGGTRLSLKYKSLKDFLVLLPPLEEQKAIAEVLNTADSEIHLLEKELESLKLQKKGLMQLLLTGIVRVQC